MLITTLAIILLSTGLWVGLPGIIEGGRVVGERGPEQLMHYPVGVPWFRGKVSTAAWVLRTGRLFAGGALLLTGLMLTAAWWPRGQDIPVSACERLAALEALGRLADSSLAYGAVLDNDHRCECKVLLDGQTFLSIEVDAPDTLIGASLEAQRRELERRSMTLRPLPGLGADAVVALHPRMPAREAIFLFKDRNGTARVQSQRSDPALIKGLARIFAAQRYPEPERKD